MTARQGGHSGLSARGLVTGLLCAAALGCSHRPPPDFAPAPGLVALIEAIRVFVPEAVCPGQTIRASYSAVLDDGTEVPFVNRYDKDHPPALHVVFLSRYSPNALALENGNWDAASDPLLSAVEGFRLRVALRAKPSVVTEETLTPDYSCTNHVYGFIGDRGRRGEAGGPGPDVTVRMAVVASPFYERLIVAGVQVEEAPPFYVFADANAVPPADWLVIASRGGPGGRGVNGRDGGKGADGQPGCRGSPGGSGGAGGNGGVGGPGGRGGRVTVIVPEEEPFLAGLVEGRSVGGEGGRGGRGGDGGSGGKGGAAQDEGRRCSAGADGASGPEGQHGQNGRDGLPGPRPRVITVPAADVFGYMVPPALAALLDYQREENR